MEVWPCGHEEQRRGRGSTELRVVWFMEVATQQAVRHDDARAQAVAGGDAKELREVKPGYQADYQQ